MGRETKLEILCQSGVSVAVLSVYINMARTERWHGEEAVQP